MLKKIFGFLKAILPVIIGLIGILTIKTLFNDDYSKIISKKGKFILSDDAKMKDVNDKISNSLKNHSLDNSENTKEIIISS